LTVQEVYIEEVKGIERRRPGFYRILRKLLSLPGFRVLCPLARRVADVMEAPGKVSIQVEPMRRKSGMDCQGLTVISANLWHDWPQHRRALERLEAFARLVEEHQADVLLLQEVARTKTFWTDHWLAQRLGMAYVYSRANGHLGGIGFEEGLAIFSRYPLIHQPVLHQLSPAKNRFTRRLALGTQIASPCGDFLAFSVHLGLAGKQNAEQTTKLSHWVRAVSGCTTALVGGDFNAGEDSQQIKNLQQHWLDTFRHFNPFGDGITHELRWPWGRPFRRKRLDYIFLKAQLNHWKVLESRHLETPGERHSDHRAVLLHLVPVPLT
jgi:endonuclease/exonuclease/phosphatase family metal-dependent hydrolase